MLHAISEAASIHGRSRCEFKTKRAFAAGADGRRPLREYVEMFTANLTSAGNTLRAIFASQPRT